MFKLVIIVKLLGGVQGVAYVNGGFLYGTECDAVGRSIVALVKPPGEASFECAPMKLFPV